jgi:hypothetical protein
MKNAFFKNLVLLAIIMSAMNLQAETITGISEPFPFGGTEPPAVVPVSPMALALGVLLIGILIFWRYYLSRKRGMV